MTNNERRRLTAAYFGKTVTVKIDRPLGSVHPKYHDIVYPVNYGYVPHSIGGDGEELDVYVLGVTEPLEQFSGRVIGVVHRENDVEDKLVAAPEGMIFYQNDIAEAVNFQEKYFKTHIDAIYQKSCGAAVFRITESKIEYLLLFQKGSQTWSFPKGHMEIGETERETALREVLEETGLAVELLPDFREEVYYEIGGLILKTVVLFLAEIKNEPVMLENAIGKYTWVVADEAKRLLYPSYGAFFDKIGKQFGEVD